MRGLLADVNAQGHLPRLRASLVGQGLWDLIVEADLRFESLADHGLAQDLDDRTLWEFCQARQLVLITNDKNNDSRNSLQATLNDSWRVGHLPVITFSNQGRFVREWPYAGRVAVAVADILIGIASGGPLERDRIFVP